MRYTDKRIAYIDYFRCAGIILMIMGHIGFGGRFDTFIHAFHMPMFFLCSGMCYKTSSGDGIKDRIRYLGRKTNKLLVPYFFFGIGHYMIWLMSNYNYDNYLSPLWHLLWDNTEGLPYAGALWFLTAFYFAQIIYYFIDTLLKKWAVKNIIVVAAAIFGCMADNIFSFKLPWALSAALAGVGFLHVGRYLADSGMTIHYGVPNKKILMVIAAGVVITYLIFLNGCVNMREGNYQHILLFWINAVGACIIGLYMAWILEKLIGGRPGYQWIDRYIQSVGKASIVYVCINQIVILVLRKVFGHIDTSVHGISKLGWHLCLLVLTLAVLFFSGRLFFRYNRMRCLIGAGFNVRTIRN